MFGLGAALASAAYMAAPKGPATPRVDNKTKRKVEAAKPGGRSAKPVRGSKQTAESSHEFIAIPPQTRVLKRSRTIRDGRRESTLKLESSLSPTDLQVFYTDLLVKDWMISRDDLTEGIGWNGVFMQIDPEEKSMGIFAVVKKIGPASGAANPTTIAILKVEKL